MDTPENNFFPEISVVVSCYFEENSISEFYCRLAQALKDSGRTFEMIFVNDGSTDRTFPILKDIFQADPNVHAVIDLTRNFGQANAVMAGLCYTRGNAILHMDSDLQLNPEEIPLFLEKYDEGYEVISGYRVNRKDSFTRVLPSKIANIVMRQISESDFSDFGCSFKLYSSKLIQAFSPSDRKTFRPTDIIRNTNRRIEIPVSHAPRKFGKSGWTFRKLWNYNMDNIVMLLEKPFQGLFLSSLALSVILILRLFFDKILDISILPYVSNGLLLNVLIVCTLVLAVFFSIQGEFTIRSYRQQLNHPTFIIRDIHINS